MTVEGLAQGAAGVRPGEVERDRRDGDAVVAADLGGQVVEPVGAAGDQPQVAARAARSSANWRPIPELAPVTRAVCLNRALLLRVHAAFEEAVLDHDDPTAPARDRLSAMARAYVR